MSGQSKPISGDREGPEQGENKERTRREEGENRAKTWREWSEKRLIARRFDDPRYQDLSL